MRGKKTEPEQVYEIMSSWAVTDNYEETSRILNIPSTTVRDVVEKNKNKTEFVILRAEKRKDFAKRAGKNINLALDRLEEMLTDREKEIPVNQLTTAIGTLFDKKALCEGNATNNVKIEVKLPPGADDYAG